MIKLNNPFNIEFNDKIHWFGQSDDLSHLPYLVFMTAPDGLRAGMVDARTKFHRHKLTTIARIIPVFAPAADSNDVTAYIADVSRRLGIDKDAVLDLDTPQGLTAYAKAIIVHENGHCPTGPDWYSDAQYAEAAQMALAVSYAEA